MSNRLTPHEQERAKAVRAALAHAAPEGPTHRCSDCGAEHVIIPTLSERYAAARLSQPDATEEAGLLEQSHRLARGMFGPHKHPGCALCATEEAIR